MTSLALLFLVVLTLNVVPKFAPPTWMVLSFVGLKHPEVNPWLVALVAALGATCGRVVLAHFARRIVSRGSLASRWFAPEVTGPAWWLYFVLTQLVMLALVYAFAKIDWHRSAGERKLRWLS